MPNYLTSNLVKAQAKLLALFQAPEKRFNPPVTWREFVRNTPIMFPDSKTLRTREDRAVEANFKERTSRVLGGARAHDHTGVKGDTGILAPTWVTSSDKFNMSLKQADNNLFDEFEQFMNEMENVFANFAEGLETDSIDFLFNNRSGVNIAIAEGTFNAIDDVFEITEATNGERAVQITKSMMRENKYGTSLVCFCDTIAFNKFEKFANQGTGNSTNLEFQFSGIRFVHSVELSTNALTLTHTDGFWIVAPEGSFAALDWIPKQNREAKETKENKYGTILNPVDGLSYAVHSFEERADDSANNGQVQDVVTQWEVSLDVAFEVAPLTVATETPIQALAFV